MKTVTTQFKGGLLKGLLLPLMLIYAGLCILAREVFPRRDPASGEAVDAR